MRVSGEIIFLLWLLFVESSRNCKWTLDDKKILPRRQNASNRDHIATVRASVAEYENELIKRYYHEVGFRIMITWRVLWKYLDSAIFSAWCLISANNKERNTVTANVEIYRMIIIFSFPLWEKMDSYGTNKMVLHITL